MSATTPSRAHSNLVLGLGKTGYSVVRHLCARGERVTAADSRESAPCLGLVRRHYPRVKIITGRLPRELFADFDRIVISPGLGIPRGLNGQPGNGNHVPMIGDIELFAQQARAPVIAVTGSNGKSTVTHLAATMLRAAGKRVLVGGNIGTPALDLLRRPPPDIYALELSSFQLESTDSLRAVAAVILNISEDHMDRYPHMRAYAAAKARILRGAIAVLNRDDPNSRALLRRHSDAISFGLNRPAARHYGVVNTAEGTMLCRGQTPLAAAAAMVLAGDMHIANVLAATALAEAAGVPATPAMMAAAARFAGLEHRAELVAQLNGVRWINDSKATNVGAAAAAIESFGAPAANLILIAGGIGKGANFAPLRSPVSARVTQAVLFGRDADLMADALRDATEITRARDLSQAVGIAAAVARAGQTVLFSPACASFDMFADYAARGAAFKRAVANLEAAQ